MSQKEARRVEFEITSSQSIYMLACEKAGVVPKKRIRAMLGRSSELSVEGLFLGQGIVALAEAISYGLGAHSKGLTVLNVAGNKIDDTTMQPLAHALSRCRALTDLDLSHNQLTAKGLDNVLCTLLLPTFIQLTRVVLAKNRFDDAALIPLLLALEENRIPALKELDIGHSCLGDDAGQAIGAMLSKNVSLDTLVLKWNKFRLHGADAVATGMLKNSKITSLDLSWNGFGDLSPLGILCEVLLVNTCLTHLNLGRNRIRANGCTVLAASLISNSTLLLLDLDGNPVGAAGAKQMVTLTLPDDDTSDDIYGGNVGVEDDEEDPAAPLKEGSFVKKSKNGSVGLDVSLLDCTLGPQESNKDALNFDADEPGGTYQLDMTRIFDRTVLRTLVRIQLEKRGGFKDNTPKMDGKPYSIRPTLDYEVPGKGQLSFTYNAYSSSVLVADTKVYNALEDLFAANSFNVRRQVLLDMVCKGNSSLTWQQVKVLINLTYGISVRATTAATTQSSLSRGQSRSTSRAQLLRQDTKSGSSSRMSSYPLLEEDLANSDLSQVAPAHVGGGEEARELGDAFAEEEEVVFTEDDDKFATAVAQHKGDLVSIFKLVEADGDGELSCRELKRAVERLLKVKLTDEEGADMFADADWDGGGSISATEWCVYLGMPSGGKRAKLSPIAEQRVMLVTSCFNRLAAEAHRARELLLLLRDDSERQEAQRRLGLCAQTFSLQNPTGFYNLDLSSQADREVAIRLRGLKMDQESLEMRLVQYHAPPRRGGTRDAIQRVWRNALIVTGGSQELIFSHDWNVPKSGRLMLDFVEITHQASNASAASSRRMRALMRRIELIESLLQPEDQAQATLQAITDFLSAQYVTCEQACILLSLFRDSAPRTAFFVKAYARIVDWHNLLHILQRFTQSEIKILGRRIGYANLFNEVMAANYYELDLSDVEQRWVVQELVHLGAVEPGKNCVEVQLQGIDFDIPAGWAADVPRRGLLELYYCRTKEVTMRVLQQGAWDHELSPWKPQGKSLSKFMQSYLHSYCLEDQPPNHGQLLAPSPFGDKWCRPNKLRRIRVKLVNAFASANECFTKLDDDGGGSINRKEMVMGLFSLGVWLHPSESSALMDALDSDGGGEIELDELTEYWDSYIFDGWK